MTGYPPLLKLSISFDEFTNAISNEFTNVDELSKKRSRHIIFNEQINNDNDRDVQKRN